MNESPNPVWRWPIVLSALTTTGLIAALFADGWIDTAACVAIATPLLVIAAKLNRHSTTKNL